MHADHAGRSEPLLRSPIVSASTPTLQSPSPTQPTTCFLAAKLADSAAVAVTPVKPGTSWSPTEFAPAVSTKAPVANHTVSHLVNITPRATEPIAPNGILTLPGALPNASEVTNSPVMKLTRRPTLTRTRYLEELKKSRKN